MSKSTEDRLEAIPALAIEVRNDLRQRLARESQEAGERELALGCEKCGRAWRVHYRRGEFYPCK